MTKEALSKIETFVKVALAEITSLRSQLAASQTKQAAVAAQDAEELQQALSKAAMALYNSDFISDEAERKLFIKRSQEDTKYLAKIVERVCNASDVAFMGKTAKVKSSHQSEDPVMRRAFGLAGNYSLLEDEE